MKLTEGGKLMPPNVCTICERTPAVGEPVVDTERYFDGFPHNLRGKRYICKRCVADAAALVEGLVSLKRLEEAEAEGNAAKLELKELKERLADVAGLVRS